MRRRAQGSGQHRLLARPAPPQQVRPARSRGWCSYSDFLEGAVKHGSYELIPLVWRELGADFGEVKVSPRGASGLIPPPLAQTPDGKHIAVAKLVGAGLK